jgi:hypothetical protein
MSSKDLGTVEKEIPKVDGADKPYPLPQLEQTDKAGKASDKTPADE